MLVTFLKPGGNFFKKSYQYSDYKSLFLNINLTTKVVNLFQEKTATHRKLEI